MGEVFRARDTKLNRDVAIKVLPAAFAQDAERLARFRREAQVLASLKASRDEAEDKRDKVVLIVNFFDELRRIAPAGRR